MPCYEMPRCCKQRVRAYFLPPYYGTQDVSLNTMRKPRRKIKMAFMGKVNSQTARVLLDSGADEVYLGLQFARHLGVEMTTNVKTVTLGDNQEISTHGGAKERVNMANCKTQWPRQIIPLNSNYDIILGDDLLEHHEACPNYRDGTVTLYKGKRRFTLRQQSETPVLPDVETSASMEPPPKLFNAIQLTRRLLKERCECFFVQLSQVEASDAERNKYPEKMKDLAAEFADVFKDTPARLPPQRDMGHSILLEPGAVPPNKPLYMLSPLEYEEARR